MKRGLPPIHPGELLKEEVIEAHGLSVTDAAKLLYVTRSALSNVLNGKAAISPEMALKIAAVFGGSAEFWITQQANYDLQKAAKNVEKLHLKRFEAA